MDLVVPKRALRRRRKRSRLHAAVLAAQSKGQRSALGQLLPSQRFIELSAFPTKRMYRSRSVQIVVGGRICRPVPVGNRSADKLSRIGRCCRPMRDICSLLWCALGGLFRSRTSLEAEILLLRHELNVLRRKSPQRMAFTDVDRLVFAKLYHLAPGVRSRLARVAGCLKHLRASHASAP
jgi:hypothetical protein